MRDKEPSIKRILHLKGDGAHCGLTDWYQPVEKAIAKALKGKGDWTTGWYASKKEIASACLTRINGQLIAEVSVSDDFDTEGNGRVEFPATTDLEAIRTSIFKAWDEAEKDRRDNSIVALWSIHDRKGRWIETYLLQCGGENDSPPGDSYWKWGWQGESKLRKATREGLKELIFSGKNGGKFGSYTVRLCDASEEEENS